MDHSDQFAIPIPNPACRLSRLASFLPCRLQGGLSRRDAWDGTFAIWDGPIGEGTLFCLRQFLLITKGN